MSCGWHSTRRWTRPPSASGGSFGGSARAVARRSCRSAARTRSAASSTRSCCRLSSPWRQTGGCSRLRLAPTRTARALLWPASTARSRPHASVRLATPRPSGVHVPAHPSWKPSRSSRSGASAPGTVRAWRHRDATNTKPSRVAQRPPHTFL